MKRFILPAMMLLACWALARGEDSNQWRGPNRNGLATTGPALDIRWGTGGPVKLWDSDIPIPSVMNDEGDGGGWGSVSVANGKAYVYVDWRHREDIPTRTLSEAGLQRLGWTRVKVPADIQMAAEEARTSPELEKLVGLRAGVDKEMGRGARHDGPGREGDHQLRG